MMADPHTIPVGPRRLLRLWALYARLDLIWFTRDWRGALSYTISDAIIYAGGVTGTLFLAVRFDGIGGWTRDQVLFMLGYAMLVSGLTEVLFNFNVSHVSRRIGRGQLDHVLLQPQPIWTTFLVEGFAPISCMGAFFGGVGLFAYALPRLPLSLDPIWWLGAAANVTASVAAVLAFSWCCGTLAFWAPRGAEEVSSSAVELVESLRGFPLDGLAPALVGPLVFVVPAGLAAWLPSRALLGIDPGPGALLATPALACLFGCVAWLLFRRGMRQYERTGSQRWLSFGHRR